MAEYRASRLASATHWAALGTGCVVDWQYASGCMRLPDPSQQSVDLSANNRVTAHNNCVSTFLFLLRQASIKVACSVVPVPALDLP